MRKSRTAIRLVAACLVAGVAGACVRPSTEAYVFSTLPTARAIDPPGYLPRGRKLLHGNQYVIPIGAVTTPTVVKAGSLVDGTATVWNINNFCSHRRFNTDSLKAQISEDDNARFVINISSAPSPGPSIDAKTFAEQFPKFPRNYIGYLDYIVIDRKQRMVYKADPETLDMALLDIRSRNERYKKGGRRFGHCGLLDSNATKYQITGIAVYDIYIQVGLAKGFMAQSKKREVAAALIKAYRYEGGIVRRIYAVFARDIL